MCTFQVGTVDFEKVFFHGCNNIQASQKLTYQITDEDLNASTGEWTNQVLVLVANRLGDKQIEPVYFKSIRQFMKLPQFVGLVGGKPKAA